jgi:hypothetical protein
MSSSHLTRKNAEEFDANDPLAHLRKDFIIPSKADLKSKTLSKSCEQHRTRKNLEFSR